MLINNNFLTLAGTGHFASFHGTRGGGWYDPPCRFAPDWARASRKKRACSSQRDEERLIYKLKVLGQPVTSEVRSSAEKGRKPVIADNLASDAARAKLQRPACSLRRVKHATMVVECPRMIFRGEKFEKKSFSGHMTSLTFDYPLVPWPHFKSS